MLINLKISFNKFHSGLFHVKELIYEELEKVEYQNSNLELAYKIVYDLLNEFGNSVLQGIKEMDKEN